MNVQLRFLTAALILTGSCWIRAPSWAHGAMSISTPEHDIALGPGGAYVYDGTSGGAVNFDLAYTHHLFAASTNLKLIRSGGQTLAGPQLELTGFLLANFGGGVGYLMGSEHGPVYHLFVGVPFGDDFSFMPKGQPFQTLYVEPYYRLNYFDPGEGRTYHELGMMLKVTTFEL